MHDRRLRVRRRCTPRAPVDRPRAAWSSAFGRQPAPSHDLNLHCARGRHHGAPRPQRGRQDHGHPHDHRRPRPRRRARCGCSASIPPSRRGGARRRCGVVSAKPALYDRLSGWDNLRYSAELYGLGRGPPSTPHPRGRRPLRHRRRARPAGRRLLDRHEDPPGAGPLGAARSRPAALRRADVGPRSRVVATPCSS